MYAKNKSIVQFASGGEELLSGIPLNEVRVIDVFQYSGKRSDLVVLDGRSVIVLHNGLRQIILAKDSLAEFAEEMSELKLKLS